MIDSIPLFKRFAQIATPVVVHTPAIIDVTYMVESRGKSDPRVYRLMPAVWNRDPALNAYGKYTPREGLIAFIGASKLHQLAGHRFLVPDCPENVATLEAEGYVHDPDGVYQPFLPSRGKGAKAWYPCKSSFDRTPDQAVIAQLNALRKMARPS